MLTTLIDELRNKGIILDTESGKLVCIAPPNAMTAELQAQIRQSKEQLLNILALRAHSKVKEDPIGISARQDSYPLSSAQRRSAMTTLPGAVLPSAYLLKGKLDRAILEQSLNLIVQRHAPLRTRFDLDSSPPTQTVTAYQPFSVSVTDLRGQDEAAITARLNELQEQGTDLSSGRVFCFELLLVEEEKTILFASFSPLVFDGRSFDLFWQEMTRTYAALETGEADPFPQLAHTYADCVHWIEQRISNRITDLRYFWKKQLGSRLPLDVFALPLDSSAEPNVSTLPLEMGEDLTRAIRKFANSAGVTPQIVLLSAIYVWASRLRGPTIESDAEDDSDIVLGIAVEGRLGVALENVIGPFANLMLLRQNIPNDLDFAQFVHRVRDDYLEAHQHQEYPIENHDIQPRKGSTRLFQIEFSFQQTSDRQTDMGSLTIEQLELPSGTTAVDLSIWVKDWGDRMSGAIEFNFGSIDTDTISMWCRCFYHMLENLVSHPDSAVGEVGFLRDDDLQALKDRFDKEEALIVDEFNRPVPLGVPGFLQGGPGLYVAHSEGYRHIEYRDGTEQSNQEQRHPTTDIECRLELLVNDLLGTTVGMHTNLFSAGLNSLLALKLIVDIKNTLAVSLNIPTLFSHPTIHALADLIESSPFVSNANTLVPLQPKGKLAPLYCICGVNLYRSIALSMGEDQPVYALYIPDESDHLKNVSARSTAELAAEYWQIIKAQHKGGALKLLGFCFGGAVAYEITRMAQKEGYTVSHLVLLDSALSKKLSRKWWSRVARGVRSAVEGLLGKNNREKLKTDSIEESVANALSARLDKYSPEETYSGNTVFVDSGDADLYSAWKKTPLLGWEGALEGTVNLVNLSTHHHELLNPTNSQIIAEHLKLYFQQG